MRNKQTRINNSDYRLIKSATREALANRTVSQTYVRRMQERGMLKTSPRLCYANTGEKWLLLYDFIEYRWVYGHSKTQPGYGAYPHRTRCTGYLGFNESLELVVIDERHPYEITYVKQDGRFTAEQHYRAREYFGRSSSGIQNLGRLTQSAA